MAKDPMLQSLCQTFPIIFSCVPELYAQHKCKYSCAREPLTQHKTSHRSCALDSTPNTTNIYIINNWLMPNIQRKLSCSYVVWQLIQKKNFNIIIMINRLIPINGRSKIQDITSLPAQYSTVPGVLGTLDDIMKQGGVSLSHGGLILPGSLIYLNVLPLHFQLD